MLPAFNVNPESRILQFGSYRLLRLSSEHLAPDLEAIRRLNLDGAACIRLPGLFLESDLARLEGAELEALVVGSGVDASRVGLMRSLRVLSLSDPPPDLSGLSALEALFLSWRRAVRLPADMPRLRQLQLSGFKPRSKDLSCLPSAPNLGSLELTQVGITSLSGVDRFPALEALTVSTAGNLTDISGVAHSKLVRCTFELCPRIEDYAALGTCANLVQLHVIDCKSMNSVAFLTGLPGLRSLSLVGTRVLDADISPALQIAEVVFDDRPEYSHSLADVAVRPSPKPQRFLTLGTFVVPVWLGAGVDDPASMALLRQVEAEAEAVVGSALKAIRDMDPAMVGLGARELAGAGAEPVAAALDPSDPERPLVLDFRAYADSENLLLAVVFGLDLVVKSVQLER